jgi:hypothetical protein
MSQEAYTCAAVLEEVKDETKAREHFNAFAKEIAAQKAHKANVAATNAAWLKQIEASERRELEKGASDFRLCKKCVVERPVRKLTDAEKENVAAAERYRKNAAFLAEVAEGERIYWKVQAEQAKAERVARQYQYQGCAFEPISYTFQPALARPPLGAAAVVRRKQEEK